MWQTQRVQKVAEDTPVPGPRHFVTFLLKIVLLTSRLTYHYCGIECPVTCYYTSVYETGDLFTCNHYICTHRCHCRLCWNTKVIPDIHVHAYICLLTAVNYSTSNSTANISSSQIAVVRYAYVVIGGIVFVASVLHAAAYWQDCRAKHAAPAPHQQVLLTEQTTNEEPSDKSPAERQCRQK